MRLLKVALIGRPNVGKSALFNRIAKQRISIVDDEEGITRDRLYAEAESFGRKFLLIDTGGIDSTGKIPFAEQVKEQARRAIEEADVLLLVVDGRVGLTSYDEEVAKELRQSKKPLFIVVNKLDSEEDQAKTTLFYGLGTPHVFGVSAMQGHQIAELLEAVFKDVPEIEEESEKKPEGIRLAIVGRPNVGKSTLLNHLLSEERSIVSPIAGTTRDAIEIPFTFQGDQFFLVDTAGIRRKKGEKEVVDKFAAIRTEEAIDRADVCLLVLDSFEGFTTQERRIASEIEAKGKSCLLLFNKWDLVKGLAMEHAMRGVREAAPFLAHCPALFISAEEGRNVEKILPLAKELYQVRHERVGTGALNGLIEKSLQKYHPPLIWGKRLRIYYLTQVETNPPKFVLFVNRPDLMTESYRKYLIGRLREAFPFQGCPVLFELKGKSKSKVTGELKGTPQALQRV